MFFFRVAVTYVLIRGEALATVAAPWWDKCLRAYAPASAHPLFKPFLLLAVHLVHCRFTHEHLPRPVCLCADACACVCVLPHVCVAV